MPKNWVGETSDVKFGINKYGKISFAGLLIYLPSSLNDINYYVYSTYNGYNSSNLDYSKL